jgi:hypothetical protein
MTDWIALPDFPLKFDSQCAPWTSATRIVQGAFEMKDGRHVLLKPTQAFLQSIESQLIDGYVSNPNVVELVAKILAANARHLDSVEWCRVRGNDLDLAVRVYAARGIHRLYLSLRGPVGRYADVELPEFVPPSVPAKSHIKKTDFAAMSLTASVARLDPPRDALVLRPLVSEARPNYGSSIAFASDGRLCVAVRTPDVEAIVSVAPTGEVAFAHLATRDELRATDVSTMTGAYLPSLYTTAAGLVRTEHYKNTTGEQERVGFEDRWHVNPRGLFERDWPLGVAAGNFLRCIVKKNKTFLLAVELATGKRKLLPLGGIQVANGAVLETDTTRGPGESTILRATDPNGLESRFRITHGKKMTLEPLAGQCAHGLQGAVLPVPHSDGFIVVGSYDGHHGLWFVKADGARHPIFALPADLMAHGYAPSGLQSVTQIEFGTFPRWLVEIELGSDHGPHVRGAVVFDSDGVVLGRSYVNASSVLILGDVSLKLEHGEYVSGWAAGPSGDLAALLDLADGASLVWVPPLRAAPSLTAVPH